MQLNTISVHNTLAPDLGEIGPGTTGFNGGAPFSGVFKDAVASVNNLADQASSAVEGLMNGSGVDVHQAMIATQKADLSFEMALAVRNKAVSAYQQVMQMQF
jgi:flagellar hook-basal body complex protein FliE